MPKTNAYYIYALTDPRSQQIRYVGKTCLAPIQRLAQHLKPSQINKQTHKARWLRQLILNNEKLLLSALETCSTKDAANKAEISWISQLRKNGTPLTNKTDGGDGQSPGYVTSYQTKQKISTALSGRSVTDEWRAKLSKARIGHRVSLETRNKLSKKRKGIRLSNETRTKMRGPRRQLKDENGIHYKNIKDVVDKLNICRTSLWRHLNGQQAHVGGHTIQFI